MSIEDEIGPLLKDLQVTWMMLYSVTVFKVCGLSHFSLALNSRLALPLAYSMRLQRSRQPAEMYFRQHEHLLEQRGAADAPDATALADRSDACAR
jgi:hypothetical protein